MANCWEAQGSSSREFVRKWLTDLFAEREFACVEGLKILPGFVQRHRVGAASERRIMELRKVIFPKAYRANLKCAWWLTSKSKKLTTRTWKRHQTTLLDNRYGPIYISTSALIQPLGGDSPRKTSRSSGPSARRDADFLVVAYVSVESFFGIKNRTSAANCFSSEIDK